MPVKAIRVGTSTVPRCFISWMVAALAKVPCSIESTPALTAAAMPASAWAWAATLRPSEWAVVDDRPHLLVGEGLAEALVALAEHAAGGVELDDVGAELGRLADLGRALVGAGAGIVAVERLGDLGPEARDVAMAADGRERLAGGEHARAGDQPLGDGVGGARSR
jgi:hypothetical protein